MSPSSLPTWNGQPVEIDPTSLRKIQQESFETLRKAMGGPSVNRLSESELLHLVEAAGHLEFMIEWVRSSVIPAARTTGASWAKLGGAMGVSRSTAQYRYEKAAKDWAAE